MFSEGKKSFSISEMSHYPECSSHFVVWEQFVEEKAFETLISLVKLED